MPFCRLTLVRFGLCFTDSCLTIKLTPSQTMKTIAVLILSSFALFVPASRATELGDTAPPLKIAEWVKGKPVDLAAGKGKQVFVVEFWATWCGPCRASIPHLTELQKKFKDKEVVFIGVSDETPAKIKPFVATMGEKMDYTVAADQGGETGAAYMGAFGVNGIPHAFVIDKDGQLAWHGHPMAGLDQVLEQLLAGKLDLGVLKKRKLAQQKLELYLGRVGSGQDDVQTAQLGQELETLDKEVGPLMPGGEKFDAAQLKETVRLQTVFQQYFQAVTGAGDKAKAEKLAKELAATKSRNAFLINELAWTLLTDENIKDRNLPLAMKLAKTAYDASEGKAPHILDTYSRALFDSGKVSEAILQQKKAIALAQDAELRKRLEENLQEYEQKKGAK